MAAPGVTLLLGIIQSLLLIDELHTLVRDDALQLQQPQELLGYCQSHLDNPFQ